MNCAQCGLEFEGTATQKYCDTQCRWDHSNGKDPERSRSRKETGFAWNPVQPARKVEVKAPKRLRSVGTWKTAAILPDPQFGFRRLDDGSLDPFHDDRALDVALQVLEVERPDLTIWLGDLLDFAPFGKYRLEPGFVGTVQPALEVAHEYLARSVALSDEVRLIEGNHDARLQNYIIDNALHAAGLRAAKSAPASWPALSVPALLRLEELGIEYVGAYPAGATYLNDNLACIHGHVVKSGGSTAAEVVKQEHVSVVFGHIHRAETHYKTRNGRGAPRILAAHSPGCLCRIDGAVPSRKSAVALRTGRPARAWEDWQQGLTIVRYEPEGAQRFVLEHIPIYEGWALHKGVEYASEHRLAA